MKIGLICKSREQSAEILELLKPFEAEVTIAANWLEIREVAIKQPFNGFIIDIKCKLGLSPEEKSFANDVQEVYPFMYIKKHPDGGYGTIMMGKSIEESSLEYFIQEACRPFEARLMRASSRKSIQFNVLVSDKENPGPEDFLPRTTVDVSHDGCFVYLTEKWKLGSRIWVIFKELSNQQPIYAEIKRLLPWGKSLVYPGIGMMFLKMKSEQMNELVSKYKVPLPLRLPQNQASN